jgi:hypothetical protein
MTDNLDNVIRKVQALTALADDPRTPPHEAASARAKADAMMFKYKIESLTTPEQPGILRPTPQWKTIWVCRSSSMWRNHYSGLTRFVLDKAQCRYVGKVVENSEDEGHRWQVYEAVGYESDLRYAEVLVASAVSAFGRHLEPQYDPTETPAANALRLRRGGMERRRISLVLFGAWETENEMKAKNRKVTKLIQQEADRIGEPNLKKELLGRSTSISTYRQSYGDSFYWTLQTRLYSKKIEDGLEGSGLVLASAADAVDEMLYERYPHLRPVAVIDGTSSKTQDKCPKCEKTKSGYCAEHRWMKPRAYRETAYSTAGARAGASAARSVDLGSSGTGKVSGGRSPHALN